MTEIQQIDGPGVAGSQKKGISIQEMSLDERPRERLLRHGSAGLSDSELVAILLRTGTRGVSAVDLARNMLGRFGGLAGLSGVCPASIRSQGVGPAKSAALLAAVEIGRRLARAELPEREPLSRPAAVAKYLGMRYRIAGQEVMGALYLDTRNRLLGESEIFRGTLNRAAVEPRAILKQGLLQDAAGFILFHTHPSGDPAPSAEDLSFTRRMADSSEVVGIRLVDHLIVGSGGRWVSLRERNAW